MKNEECRMRTYVCQIIEFLDSSALCFALTIFTPVEHYLISMLVNCFRTSASDNVYSWFLIIY